MIRMKKYRLAILASHPIHYHVPLFRKLAQNDAVDLVVYFCSDYGVKDGIDPEFGVKVKWGIPLLDGYRYIFLRNFFYKFSFGFFGQTNPGIISELFKNDYDAIIIYGYAFFTNWLAVVGSMITRTPLILGGEMVLYLDRPWWKRFLKSMVLKFIFWNARAFLSIGSFSTKLYRHYGILEEKIFDVPYAVDNDHFMAASKALKSLRAELRSKMGIGKNDIVILFVGKLIEKKRPMDLLRAYELLITNYGLLVTTHLLFVGDGVLRPELEKYAEEHNLKNSSLNPHSANSDTFASSGCGVHFVGFKNQTELSACYAISDVFVLPSTSQEVSPVTINEAMCFGLPIVVSGSIPSARDFVKHNENGFIFPLGEINTLAAHLKELADEPEKRRAFGEKSLEMIQEHSYEKDIEGILSALKYIKTSN